MPGKIGLLENPYRLKKRVPRCLRHFQIRLRKYLCSNKHKRGALHRHILAGDGFRLVADVERPRRFQLIEEGRPARDVDLYALAVFVVAEEGL